MRVLETAKIVAVSLVVLAAAAPHRALGAQRSAVLLAAGPGAATGHIPNQGEAWQALRDNDGDANYVFAPIYYPTGGRTYVALESLPSDIVQISSLTCFAIGRIVGASGATAMMHPASSWPQGTDRGGGITLLASDPSYQSVGETYYENPFTHEPLTIAEVSQVQCGVHTYPVSVFSSYGAAWITQVYLVVAYDDGE